MRPTRSYWLDSAGDEAPRAALSGARSCDVVVLGGGIAGVCAAYLLACAGADVVLIEAETTRRRAARASKGARR